jgi:hypothetical protein
MPPLQNPNSFPAPQPPSDNGQSPYDFFLDSDSAPRNNMSASKKLLLIVGGTVGLLAALAVVLATFTGGGKEAPQLVLVIQSQAEIVRVAQDGKKNVQAENLKNYSLTAATSLTSAQTELTEYASKMGTKINKKQLGGGKKSSTDKALASAITSSTYDSTYTSVMQNELLTYEKKLSNASKVALSDTERAMLQRFIVGAQLLQLQLTTP